MFLLFQVFVKFERTWVVFEACSTLNNKEMPKEVKTTWYILHVYMEQNKAFNPQTFNSQNKMYYIPFLL